MHAIPQIPELLVNGLSPAFFRGDGPITLDQVSIPAPVHRDQMRLTSPGQQQAQRRQAAKKAQAKTKVVAEKLKEGYKLVLDSDFNYLGVAKNAHGAVVLFVRDSNSMMKSPNSGLVGAPLWKHKDIDVYEHRGVYLAIPH